MTSTTDTKAIFLAPNQGLSRLNGLENTRIGAIFYPIVAIVYVRSW